LAKSLSARTNVKRIGVGFGDKSCLLDSTGSQDGGHAEQRSVLLVFTIKLWSGSRQQSVELNKTTVALDLKVDRTNAKPSAEDLAGKQDNS
jgi:hypothetical protein